jgi:hypothetical protein
MEAGMSVLTDDVGERGVAASVGGRMDMVPRFDMDEEDWNLLRFGPLNGGEPRGGQLTGTKALMLAVLEDGIRCFLGRSKRFAEEAELWIHSQRRYSPFAFVVVCETLGLDPESVRATVERMKAENISPRQAIPRSRNNVRIPGRVRLRKRRLRRPSGNRPRRR